MKLVLEKLAFGKTAQKLHVQGALMLGQAEQLGRQEAIEMGPAGDRVQLLRASHDSLAPGLVGYFAKRADQFGQELELAAAHQALAQLEPLGRPDLAVLASAQAHCLGVLIGVVELLGQDREL